MPKKKTYKERQYNLSNEEMLVLVLAFQKGDERAGIKMLEVFENFLTNFVKLLYHGVYDRNNYELRRFISFYIPEGFLRYKLMRNNLNTFEIRQVNDVVRGISGMVQRTCEFEDVEQSIKLSFLQTLRIYKPKDSSQGGKVPIPNFISNYSLYLFKKVTDTYLINQLGRHTFPLIDEKETNDKTDYSEQIHQGMAPPPGPSLEDYLNRDEFDEEWIKSADGIFSVLTPAERQIIYWRYIKGMKASEIAAKLMEHSNTTREKIGLIREKLATVLMNQQKELNEIG